VAAGVGTNRAIDVVRPSMALRRPLVCWVTCGVTFRLRIATTHARVT